MPQPRSVLALGTRRLRAAVSPDPSFRASPPTPMLLRSAFLASLLVLFPPALPALTSAAYAQADLSPPPSSPEAAFDAAHSLYDGSLFPQAERAFAAFQRDFPTDPRLPEALYYQAHSALAMGSEQRAATLFERFEQSHPRHPLAGRARLALGRHYVMMSQYDKARTALAEVLAGPLPAIYDAEAAYLLGLTAQRQGDDGEAEAAFARAGQQDTPTAPKALYALGALRLRNGNDTDAADAFEALADRYPDSPDNRQVGLGLAEAYVRLGRLDAAAAELDVRRPVLTGDAAARADVMRAEVALLLGEEALARDLFSRVPEDAPVARRATMGRARLAYAANDWERATDLFTAVRTASDGREGDPLTHEASYYEGLALKQLGRLGEAERRLEASQQHHPEGAYADASLLELGLLRYERRRLDEAVATFENLLNRYPSSPLAGDAARLAGESYAALGQTERAREAYTRAEELGAGTAETRAEVAFQDAFALFEAAEYERAIDALLDVYRSAPAGDRAAEALFWAGEAAFRGERYARAEELLIDFLSRFPEHRQATPARYVLAWTHFRRRDYAAAAGAYERFLSAYSRSQETVPYYADALLRLGDSYYALGRFADARAVYGRVPSAPLSEQGADYALFQTAQAFVAENQPQRALETLGSLLARYPRSDLRPQALTAQGTILFAQGRFDEAITAYQRLVEDDPSSSLAPRALVGIADAHYNEGRYDEAEAAYRRVITRHTGSPFVADALEGLQFTLEVQGRTDEIDQVIAETERQATDPAVRAQLQLRRAQLALDAGNAGLAIERLRALLRQNPPADVRTEARLTLASAYLAANQPAEAASILETLYDAENNSPLGPEIALRLADAQLRAEDPETTLTMVRTFSQRHPDDAERIAEAMLLEIRALEALGRPDEAEARRRHLLNTYPESGAARQVQPDGALPGTPALSNDSSTEENNDAQ